jgi:hypothetical protein
VDVAYVPVVVGWNAECDAADLDESNEAPDHVPDDAAAAAAQPLLLDHIQSNYHYFQYY